MTKRKQRRQKPTTVSPQSSKLSEPRLFQPKVISNEVQSAPQGSASATFSFSNINVVDSSSIQNSLIQPKLTIGQPNDKYKEEANVVAQQIIQQIHSPSTVQRGIETQGTSTPFILQHSIQRHSSLPVGLASNQFESQLNQSRSGGSPLQPKLQTQLESAMGADFSGVKIHNDARADQLSRSIQAKAFTTGQDVFFKQGEYNPNSRGGQELIAHELTHVVQQSPTVHRSLDRSAKPLIQREITGPDPVNDSNIVNPDHVNDLLYGLEAYRGTTRKRVRDAGEDRTQKRTIDQYNAAVAINPFLHPGLAGWGVYHVRNALENPQQWKQHLGGKVVYPDDAALSAYENGDNDAISNEQKWMTFLVQEKHNIGLWDFGNTHRPVIGTRCMMDVRGEAEGLTRIKEKRRFGKNTDERDEGNFTEEDVHEMLSFGTDIEAAKTHLYSLSDEKKAGVNRWIQNAFFRRTSKLGIKFATSLDGLDARIHFNLTSGVQDDAGAWEAVAWGILDDIAADEGKRKITESEWRYAKRLIADDPSLRSKILAYSEY